MHKCKRSASEYCNSKFTREINRKDKHTDNVISSPCNNDLRPIFNLELPVFDEEHLQLLQLASCKINFSMILV